MQSTIINVEQFLRNLGISAKYISSSHKWVASCPNPKHRGDVPKGQWDNWVFTNRSIPTWGIVDRPGDYAHASHHCHSCKFGGGPWELAAVIWGCSVEEAGKRVIELFSQPTSLKIPKIKIALPRTKQSSFELPQGVVIPGPTGHWYQPALDYLLESRGITRDQCNRWGIGYAIRGRLLNRVVFPVYTEGVLRTYSARAISKNMKRYDMGLVSMGAEPKRALYGEPYFDYSIGIVTVAEGCPSVLALERAGAPNPCGILGSYVTPERALLLSRFKRIIVATDPDEAGNRAAQVLSVFSRRAFVQRLFLDVSPDDTPIDVLSDKLHAVLRSF